MAYTNSAQRLIGVQFDHMLGVFGIQIRRVVHCLFRHINAECFISVQIAQCVDKCFFGQSDVFLGSSEESYDAHFDPFLDELRDFDLVRRFHVHAESLWKLLGDLVEHVILHSIEQLGSVIGEHLEDLPMHFPGKWMNAGAEELRPRPLISGTSGRIPGAPEPSHRALQMLQCPVAVFVELAEVRIDALQAVLDLLLAGS